MGFRQGFLTLVTRFRPKSEMDYGTLSCLGYNDIGGQEYPCSFTISPASNALTDRDMVQKSLNIHF